MKLLKLVVSLILVAGSFFLCERVISNSRISQKEKSDLAELNSVKYGLFSVDAWKSQLTTIVADEFDKLHVSEETERELSKHVAVVLNKMIDEAAARVEKANSKTTSGKFKQVFIDMFVDVKDIKKGIPEYTAAVMQELKNPKTKKQIRTLLDKQVAEFATKTGDLKDQSLLQGILAGLGVNDVDTARTKLGVSVATISHEILTESMLMIVVGISIFVLFLVGKEQMPTQFIILILSLVSLLAAGIATPMIDMEARISQLKFMLIGHPILFEDQILYFQSKSILDVFWLMITDSQIQMKLVGILVVSFSVVFPLLKLLSTVAYYFNVKRAKDRAVIKFFVHKSGKWSMADVMVVAIFMAYIGFNGVINSQLKDLNVPDSGVDIIATNGTSLQPGYYVFLTYVLIAVLLSGFLTKKMARNANEA